MRMRIVNPNHIFKIVGTGTITDPLKAGVCRIAHVQMTVPKVLQRAPRDPRFGRMLLVRAGVPFAIAPGTQGQVHGSARVHSTKRDRMGAHVGVVVAYVSGMLE